MPRMSPADSHLLGPFIGNVAASGATIWLHFPGLKPGEGRSVYVTLHQGELNAPVSFSGMIKATYDDLNTGVVNQLDPGTLLEMRF